MVVNVFHVGKVPIALHEHDKTYWATINDFVIDGNTLTEVMNAARIFAETKITLDTLTDEQRKGLFLQYCTHCGSTDPNCQCWNDE